MPKILVDKAALRELLTALVSPGPRVREIQTTRSFPGNPLDVLLADLSATDGAHTATRSPQKVFLVMNGSSPDAICGSHKRADEHVAERVSESGLPKSMFRTFAFDVKE